MSHHPELMDLGIDIIEHLNELQSVVIVMEKLDKTYIKEPSLENKTMMLEIIERYDEIIRKVRILFQAYFSEERQRNLPVDFKMRQYYHQVK